MTPGSVLANRQLPKHDSRLAVTGVAEGMEHAFGDMHPGARSEASGLAGNGDRYFPRDDVDGLVVSVMAMAWKLGSWGQIILERVELTRIATLGAIGVHP
jgi:hypothetical protein